MLKIDETFFDGFGVKAPIHPYQGGGDYRVVAGYGNMEDRGVSHQEGCLLAAAAFGRRVLEIGTASGVSTMFLSSVAKYVDTVDPVNDNGWVAANVKLPETVRLLTNVRQADRIYDFAFIDGNHGKNAVVTDIADCTSRMPEGGILAFHDIDKGGPDKAVTQHDSLWQWRVEFPTITRLTFVGFDGGVR